MVTAVTELVFKGFDNDFEIVMSLDGQVVDFAAITRMTIEADGQTFDSAVDADLITWSALGVITVDLGASLLPKGSYEAIIVAYDPLHPNGQVIVHPSSNAVLKVNVL